MAATHARIATLIAAVLIAMASAAPALAQEAGTPAAGLAEEPWIDVVVPAEDLPQDTPVSLGFFHVVWAPGPGYRFQEDWPGIGVNCVLSGQWAFRPVRAEVVVRAAAPAEETVAPAAVETTLGPGDCALLHQDVNRDERNAGSAPLEFLALAIIPDDTLPPANTPAELEIGPFGYIYGGNWSGQPHAPQGPVRLSLRRQTLAAGTSLPAQTQAGDALIMLRQGTLGLTPTGGRPLVERAVSFGSPAPLPIDEGSETILESGDSAHIQDETTFTLRNPGAASASWWLITVAPTAGAAETAGSTPAAPAASAAAMAPTADSIEFLWASSGGPEPLDSPYGLGVDPEGNLWVADGNNDRFQIFAPEGTYLDTWGVAGAGEGEFNFAATFGGGPVGYGDVAFDAAGNIYVADPGNHRIQKFDPGRAFLLAWGSEGREDAQFLTPGSIAVDEDGVVYVSDERRADVQRFDGAGRFLGTIGGFGMDDGQFNQPSAVTIDADGAVWVTDWSTHRVQRFSPEGALLAAWGTPGSEDGELQSPNDVAVDAAGHVYIWDDQNWRLQVFTRDGQFLAKVEGYGTEPGQFLSGAGLALGADGTLYVSDMERDDVQAFRLVLPERDS